MNGRGSLLPRTFHSLSGRNYFSIRGILQSCETTFKGGNNGKQNEWQPS